MGNGKEVSWIQNWIERIDDSIVRNRREMYLIRCNSVHISISCPQDKVFSSFVEILLQNKQHNKKLTERRSFGVYDVYITFTKRICNIYIIHVSYIWRTFYVLLTCRIIMSNFALFSTFWNLSKLKKILFCICSIL